jgi:predicted kinase
MRWIDVMSEVAFVTMDLRDRPDLAHRFLNAYVEITGDYAGLNVLRFYLVYRAMVRAKVARLRAEQLAPGSVKSAALAESRGYVKIAADYAQPPGPALIITHGLAGSGKTTLSQALLELIGAVRIRTDVERKRLHDLPATVRGRNGIDADVYAPETTRETYLRALQLARVASSAGWTVIIDAAFLKRWQRQLFRDLASESGIRFTIVDFVAATATLRERIMQRLLDPHESSDADLAILEHQVQTQEQLAPDELDDTVLYDAQRALAEARLPESWRAVLDRLAAAPTAELCREFATGGCRSAAAGIDRPPADRPGA